MPRIKNYVQDQTVTAQDKVIGSDVSGVTRNYTMKQIADFAAENAGVHKHYQNNASTSWVIDHNLDLDNYLPSVTLKLDTGTFANVQGMGIVTWNTKDRLTISFSSAQTGYAYIKK